MPIVNTLVISADDTAIITEVMLKLEAAREDYDAAGSFHEGFSVLNAQVCALWDMVRCANAPTALIRAQAIDVAAMAFRFLADVCPGS